MKPGNKGWRELNTPAEEEERPVLNFLLGMLVVVLWIGIIIAVFCF